MSRDRADRLEDLWSLDALGAQLLHQFTAQPLVTITVLRFHSHVGKSSCAGQPPRHSSIFAARFAEP